MTVTPAVKLAIEDLKKAAAGKGKGGKQIKDSVNHVASCLTLLNSSSLPSKSMEKLNTVLRKPMIPLYIAFPTQALHFSVTVFECIFSDKVSTALEIGDDEARKSWEMVQRSIFSGILDFIETNDSSQNKDIAAKVLYSAICDVYFPTSSSVFPAGASLQSTAYTLLCEIASSHTSNKHKLRDPQILGGKRLGFIISQTKDFLALESLLNLFAVILPSTNNTSYGRAKRTKFIQDVFDSPQKFTCGKEVIRILESVATSDWEITAMKIIDILAKSNVAFPQPFQLNEFRACDTSFLLPNVVDRLYVDRKSFFANVDQGEVFETFEARYSQVRDIKLSMSSDPRATLVTIGLSSAPSVGESIMTLPPRGQPMNLMFHLQSDDVERFLKSLHSRALGDRLVHNQRKVSYAELLLDLDVDDLKALQPSAKDKVKTVERIFHGLSSEGHFYSDPLVETEDALVDEAISTYESPLVIDVAALGCCLSNGITSPAKETFSPHALLATGAGAGASVAPAMLVPVISKPVVDLGLPNVSQEKRALDAAVFGTSNGKFSGGGHSPAILHPFKEFSGSTSVLGDGSQPKRINQRFDAAPARIARWIIDSDDEDQTILAEQKTKPFGKRKAMANDCEDEIEPVLALSSGKTEPPSVLSKTDATYAKPPAGRTITTRKASLASVDLSSHVQVFTRNASNILIKDKIPDNSAVVTKDSTPTLTSIRITSVPTMPAKVSHLLTFDHDSPASDHVTLADESNEEMANTGTTRLSPFSKPTDKSTLLNPLGPHNSAPSLRDIPGDSRKASSINARRSLTVRGGRTSNKVETPGTFAKPENVDVTPKRKRKVETVLQGADSGPDDPESDHRPIKRLRSPCEDTKKVQPSARGASEVFGTRHTKTTRGRKRYGNGKKRRTSSPHSSIVVNYDQIPANVSPHSGRRRDIHSDTTKVTGNSRVAAMKGKEGTTKEYPPAKTKAKTLTAPHEVLPPVDDSSMHPMEAQPRRSKRNAKADVPMQTALKRSDRPVPKVQLSNSQMESNRDSEFQTPQLSSSALVADSTLKPSPKSRMKQIPKAKDTPLEMAELFDGSPYNFTPPTVETAGSEDDAPLIVSTEVDQPDRYYVEFEEYTVPIKRSSLHDPPTHSSQPQVNVEMIDLTQGSPVRVKGDAGELRLQTEYVHDNRKYFLKPDLPVHPQRPTTRASSPRLDAKGNRPPHSVAFAPFLVRPVSPIKRSHETLPETNRLVIGVPGPRTRKKPAISPLNIGPGKRHEAGSNLKYEDRPEYDLYKEDGNEERLQAIVDVLNEINQVVIQNISRRFEGVRSDVRSGRDRLLHDAAMELKNMYNESGHHFHALIDLEREYADGRRKIINCFEDVHMVNQNICQQIQHTLQQHDRNTLSKKFPNSLFSAPPASIFQNVISL